MLPTTKPYQDLLGSRIRKREVDIEFYETSAVIDKNWKKANQEQRQAVTRFAVHGFQHKLCKNKQIHNPTVDCECGLCEKKKCERYHIVNCESRTKTITEYSKERTSKDKQFKCTFMHTYTFIINTNHITCCHLELAINSFCPLHTALV